MTALVLLIIIGCGLLLFLFWLIASAVYELRALRREREEDLRRLYAEARLEEAARNGGRRGRLRIVPPSDDDESEAS